jgi:enoyl-CoA hydratase/carnithine racemase
MSGVEQASGGAVLYEIVDRTAVITLNRPEKLNAVNSAVRDGLLAAWRDLEADERVRVAVLTGAGSRAFSAGRDLAERIDQKGRGFIPILGDDTHVSKPVIAAVNGVAFGGGFFMTQACDLCVASETASFGLPEVKVGRGPVWACWLDGMLPQKVILELTMTGDPIDARRAYELGLVNRLVPTDRLMDEAMRLADRIATAAPLAVRASKAMVYRTAGMQRQQALSAAIEIFDPVFASEDAQEGMDAFNEKRAPRWRGR